MSRWEGDERRDMSKIDVLIEKFLKLEKDLAVVKSFVNSENGNHIHHLDTHYKTLAKHNELLFGNGKPGIIDMLTRIDLNLVHIKEWASAHKKEDDERHQETIVKFNNINKTLSFQNKIIYGAFGIIAFLEFVVRFK